MLRRMHGDHLRRPEDGICCAPQLLVFGLHDDAVNIGLPAAQNVRVPAPSN